MHLNKYLNVIFVVLERLKRRLPLCEHAIYLEFWAAKVCQVVPTEDAGLQ